MEQPIPINKKVKIKQIEYEPDEKIFVHDLHPFERVGLLSLQVSGYLKSCFHN